jgi:H/ACA ribonucleoprotein complex subunit 3
MLTQVMPLIDAARFSPDDRFSKERIECKKRFNLLMTQHPEPEF